MRHLRPTAARRAAAFTMVELALCIGIVAIAMVAIIGVLPIGLNVQKQNREETIIDQDATLLMDALRNGAIQFDDLTNYVDYIVIGRARVDAPKGTGFVTNGFVGRWFNGQLGNVPGPSPKYVLHHAQEILGLLSLPKYDFALEPGQPSYTNHITAQFRAFSGALSDKVLPQQLGAIPQAGQLNFAFRYLLNVEIVPVLTQPLNTLAGADQRRQLTLNANLYDVLLTFRWPVFGEEVPARAGANQKSYRCQVAGRLALPVDPLTGNVTNMPDTNLRVRRFDPGSVLDPGPVR